MKNPRLLFEIAFVAIALSATAWIFWKRVIPLSQPTGSRAVASQPFQSQAR